MNVLTGSPTIPYDEAVTEVRALFDRAEHDLWRVAEVAARLVPEHGKETLKRFAADIDRAYNTINDYRATYEAWTNTQGIQWVSQKPGQPGFLPITVAKELNKHPEKERIVLEHPALKQAEARKLMREFNEAKKPKTKTKKPKPDPKPKPEGPTAYEKALHAYDRRKAAGESLTIDAIEKEAGVSTVTAEKAIGARKAQEAQAEEQAGLSNSQQAQVDAAIQAEIKRLGLLFETKVHAEVKKRLDEYVLPSYHKTEEAWKRAILNRRGVLKYDEYRKVMKCLHTDTIAYLNPSQETRDQFDAAFRIFKQYELALCNEKEKPSGLADRKIPKTVDDLMAQAEAVKRAAKAARQAGKSK